jgi:transposase-like protein
MRGLSVRDVEATLEEALGPGVGISRSTASRICAQIKEKFDRWRVRDLSGIELDVLYLDGSPLPLSFQANPHRPPLGR